MLRVSQMNPNEVKAWHKYQCIDCKYGSKLTGGGNTIKDNICCDYIGTTGKLRKCSIAECEKFEPKGRRQVNRELRRAKVQRELGVVVKLPKVKKDPVKDSCVYNRMIKDEIDGSGYYTTAVSRASGIEKRALVKFSRDQAIASKEEYEKVRKAVDELGAMRDKIRDFVRRTGYSYRSISEAGGYKEKYISNNVWGNPSEELREEIVRIVKTMDNQGFKTRRGFKDGNKFGSKKKAIG